MYKINWPPALCRAINFWEVGVYRKRVKRGSNLDAHDVDDVSYVHHIYRLNPPNIRASAAAQSNGHRGYASYPLYGQYMCMSLYGIHVLVQ